MSAPAEPVRWIALLRGVNVGGITVKSAPLAALFTELGFASVKTVLASGNVAFDAEQGGDRAALKAKIEAGLAERFGYEAWIVLVTQQELVAVAGAYPFPRRDETHHPYVIFGSDEAVLDELAASITALESPHDQIARGRGVLYWTVERGQTLNTPASKLIGRAKYKSSTTNRNLRTVEKLTTA